MLRSCISRLLPTIDENQPEPVARASACPADRLRAHGPAHESGVRRVLHDRRAPAPARLCAVGAGPFRSRAAPATGITPI
ncbi:hypothetical protein BURCENBC7_AP3416 [Burkholderia cenocepacia BC7]|nr:hypothetical protein BURCENK562V_C2882 [Burkholderia cenocepacia K56-2Valvano]ERI26906.1 hypothetical protein BURCENBC7_AP3416 [Burkholderia cenocepacia BC7]